MAYARLPYGTPNTPESCEAGLISKMRMYFRYTPTTTPVGLRAPGHSRQFLKISYGLGGGKELGAVAMGNSLMVAT